MVHVLSYTCLVSALQGCGGRSDPGGLSVHVCWSGNIMLPNDESGQARVVRAWRCSLVLSHYSGVSLTI